MLLLLQRIVKGKRKTRKKKQLSTATEMQVPHLFASSFASA